MPKVVPPELPAHLRPLQIPTCWRRLAGALAAAEAGPVVEANLGTFQAAVRGSECGRNVTA
eukprot:2517629-Alexandrium_andersonii.AAC.1